MPAYFNLSLQFEVLTHEGGGVLEKEHEKILMELAKNCFGTHGPMRNVWNQVIYRWRKYKKRL